MQFFIYYFWFLSKMLIYTFYYSLNICVCCAIENKIIVVLVFAKKIKFSSQYFGDFVKLNGIVWWYYFFYKISSFFFYLIVLYCLIFSYSNSCLCHYLKIFLDNKKKTNFLCVCSNHISIVKLLFIVGYCLIMLGFFLR